MIARASSRSCLASILIPARLQRAGGRAQLHEARPSIAGLDALTALGVRALFVAHWVDNGFAGAAIEGGVKGKFINVLGRVQTGA